MRDRKTINWNELHRQDGFNNGRIVKIMDRLRLKAHLIPSHAFTLSRV